MKLKIEKHPDCVKLAHYFKKIEALAEKMGIDIDDLIHLPENNGFPIQTSCKKEIKAITQQRVNIYSKKIPSFYKFK